MLYANSEVSVNPQLEIPNNFTVETKKKLKKKHQNGYQFQSFQEVHTKW